MTQYGTPAAGQVNTDLIERLHSRASAALLILRHHSGNKALDNLAYETLEDRRKKHVLRRIGGKVPPFFNTFITFVSVLNL